MDYTYPYSSPLGSITLASDGEMLTGLWFDGQRFFGSSLGPVHAEKSLPVFDQTMRWLDAYFKGQDPGERPMMNLRGTAFSRRVWQILLSIPYGQTMTYGGIAALLGKTMSAQAVGGAVARNPISIIIPCHRVVGANGRLTGYAGGLQRKTALLCLEGAAGLDPAKLKYEEKR